MGANLEGHNYMSHPQQAHGSSLSKRVEGFLDKQGRGYHVVKILLKTNRILTFFGILIDSYY